MQTTGSGATQAVQFTLPFNPDPLTYNQHLDFSTGVAGLNFDASAEFGISDCREIPAHRRAAARFRDANQDRFFIVQDAAPEVTLDVTADLTNPSVNGTVGFLGIHLGSRPGDSQ